MATDPVTRNQLEERFAITARGELTISNVSGHVSVRGENRSDIILRAVKRGSSRAMENTQIDISQDGDHVTAATKSGPGGLLNFTRNLSSVHYDVLVPRSCLVHIRTVSADVRVRDVVGLVEVQTVSGDVGLDTITCDCTVTTVSGDVPARAVVGTVLLRTTSGDAQILSSRLRSFNLNSVSGDFTVETPLTANQHYSAKTVSGDLLLLIPESTGATVQMKSVSGSVTSELPAEIIKAGRRSWQGRINGGGASVEMGSVSGDLKVARGSSFADVPVGDDEVEVASSSVVPGHDGTEEEEDADPGTAEVLAALQRGEISVDEAMARLEG